MKRQAWLGSRVLPALLLFCLAGCQALGRAQPTQGAIFRPPTPVGQATLTPSATDVGATPGTSTPTPPCRDALIFISDVTIEDGSAAQAGERLDKQWEVENAGSCSWGAGYQIRLVAGASLGAAREQALYPARAGSKAILRIEFIAPAESGAYRSAWQAFSPAGEPFGDPFFIDFVVP